MPIWRSIVFSACGEIPEARIWQLKVHGAMVEKIGMRVVTQEYDLEN